MIVSISGPPSVFVCSEILKSLLGHLHHAIKVVYPGHPFLHRLCDLLHCTHSHSQSRFIRVNHDKRADLAWWSVFLCDWNGISFFTSPNWLHLSDLQLLTDATGDVGFGAFLDGHCFLGL